MCDCLPPYRYSHLQFGFDVYQVCFCCWHSPVKDMNVRMFVVGAMDCLHIHCGPEFNVSSARCRVATAAGVQ